MTFWQFIALWVVGAGALLWHIHRHELAVHASDERQRSGEPVGFRSRGEVNSINHHGSVSK